MGGKETEQIQTTLSSSFEDTILFYLSRKQDIFRGSCRIKYLAAFSLARPVILDRCEGLLVHMFEIIDMNTFSPFVEN